MTEPFLQIQLFFESQIKIEKVVRWFFISKFFKDIKSPTRKSKVQNNNIPPYTAILFKDNKLRKHQVNLIQKKFNPNKTGLFEGSFFWERGVGSN